MANPEAKNRFQRHDELRAAQKRQDVKNAADREACRQLQKKSWVNPSRSSGVSNSGVPLDAATLAARDAERARRAAAKNPVTPQAPAPLTPHEEGTLARAWANGNSEWYGTDYNVAVMKSVIEAYNLPKTFAGFDAAFKFCVENNHLEPKFRHRGQPAPRPFVAPKREIQAEPVVIRPVRIRQEIPAEEYQRLQEMPLDKLRAKARAGMKAYNAKRGE